MRKQFLLIIIPGVVIGIIVALVVMTATTTVDTKLKRADVFLSAFFSFDNLSKK